MRIRIDDIGASSKYYNQHARIFRLGKRHFSIPGSNLGALKRLPLLKGWGPYEELSANEWANLLVFFQTHKIRPLIGITACWVEPDGALIPFPDKFPEEARVIKQGFEKNIIDLANHGLTHCIVGKHMPLKFRSNRAYHREFWPELDQDYHMDHIMQSQQILEDYFRTKITAFIPPGNVWSKKTHHALLETNVTRVLANRYMLDDTAPMHKIHFIPDHDNYFVIHDRDIKFYGHKWLLRKPQVSI